MSRIEPFRASGCTSFFDELQRIDAWEDAFNSFRWIWTATSTLPAQRLPAVLRIFHLSFRPVRGDQNAAALLPGVSGFHNFEARKPAAPWAGLAGRCLTKAGERYDLREVLTPICVLAGCLGLRMSGWIRKKHCPCWKAFTPPWWCGIFWSGKSVAASGRSPTPPFCVRSSCSLRTTSAAAFPFPLLATL